MNDLDDIEWTALGDSKSKPIFAVLYDDCPRPTKWQALNPLAWIKYFKRKHNPLIAYWEIDDE